MEWTLRLVLLIAAVALLITVPFMLFYELTFAQNQPNINSPTTTITQTSTSVSQQQMLVAPPVEIAWVNTTTTGG